MACTRKCFNQNEIFPELEVLEDHYLQDPLPGILDLLHSPGGPGSAGDVERVQAGPGVWLLLPGEVVELLTQHTGAAQQAQGEEEGQHADTGHTETLRLVTSSL